MKKKYLRLTKDQKQRGIIFSSTLIPKYTAPMFLHEVHKDDKNKEETIKNLINDSAFDGSLYKYNLIRK